MIEHLSPIPISNSHLTSWLTSLSGMNGLGYPAMAKGEGCGPINRICFQLFWIL